MKVTSTAAALNLKTLFPFELDDFQKQAIAALDARKSAVVCAPTGSGKTVIGEYAIYRALAQGRRVFYTTPLKALSNQKWRDFSNQYGPEQVGLLTGDVSIHRHAPVVVMTTEIFRNMLYGTPIGEVGTSLTGVEVVVLDECHYMNDRQRGTVWEESIIYCPPEIQLLALSATVANSAQLTDWINQVHGSTELIHSDFRPVPLQFHFCTAKGFMPLLDGSRKKINPRLRFRSQNRNSKGRRSGQPASPSLAFVLSQLQQRDLLPAIYFIFSRRACDQAVQTVGNLRLVTSGEAKQLQEQIDRFLTQHPGAGRAEQIDPLYGGIAAHHAGLLPAWKALVEGLFQQGLVKVVFATETLAAGINMPARTTVISSLSKRTDRGHRLLNPSEFLQMAGRAGRRGMDQQGYVVTVQTAFEGAREAAYLSTAEADPLVSQFTPSYGMVLNLLQTHTLGEAKELVERSFGQYLATLYLQPQQRAIAELCAVRDQLKTQLATVEPKQLAQYDKLRQRLREERRLLKTLQQQAEEVRSSTLAVAATLAEPGTILILRGKHVPAKTPLPTVLVTTVPGAGQFPYLVCLSQDNNWLVVTVADVLHLPAELPRLTAAETLSLPDGLPLKPGRSQAGTEDTLAVSQRLRELSSTGDPDLFALAPEVEAQMQRVAAVKAQLETHPAHQWGNPTTLLKRQRRLEALEIEIQERQAELGEQSHRHWEEFLALLEILWHFGCLETLATDHQDRAINPERVPEAAPMLLDRAPPRYRAPIKTALPEHADQLKPTPLGQTAAATRGDNELWLALALTSGHLDLLDPCPLAAVCAALVTDVSRPDTWTSYSLSATVEDVLDALWDLRRHLIRMQVSYHVEFLVLPAKWEDRKLTALVEQWAQGVEWTELCSNTSLDEGDVVRILRRTLDFLCQIPHIPHLSESIRRSASAAIQLIDRFPVNLIGQELTVPTVEDER